MIRRLFNWIFKKEIEALNKRISEINKTEEKFRHLFDNMEVGVDVNPQSGSWAVISLQGERSDFIKFMHLGRKDIYEISRFLRHFDRSNRIKVDAAPRESAFIKTEARRF